jgi:hypothetical protein
MPSTKTKFMKTKYDLYKSAYEAWFTEGTLDRARDKLTRDGVVNSMGRPYSRDGIRKAAVKYMVQNYEESKEVLIASYRKFGYEVNEENIERYMIKLAISSFFTPNSLKEWLKENNLYGKHKEFIHTFVDIDYND